MPDDPSRMDRDDVEHRAMRPTVFLDRDGTINVERHFLRAPQEVALIPGTLDALRRLVAAGFTLVVITNQSGIARGYLDEAALARIHEHLHAMLDGLPTAYLHCPHHPDADGPYGRACTCRKPGTGLYEDAAALLGLDLARSAVVGDSARDVLPALRLGMPGWLVSTGKPVDAQLSTLREHGVPNPEELVVDDLEEATARILSTRIVTRPSGRGTSS